MTKNLCWLIRYPTRTDRDVCPYAFGEILHCVQNDKNNHMCFFARQCDGGEVVSGIPRADGHDVLRKNIPTNYNLKYQF